MKECYLLFIFAMVCWGSTYATVVENNLNRVRKLPPQTTYVPPDIRHGYKYAQNAVNRQKLPQNTIAKPVVAKKSQETLYSVENEHEQAAHEEHFSIDHTQLLLQQQLQHEHALHTLLSTNPLLAAVILSQSLGLPAQPFTHAHGGYNSAAHQPLNPYVALLLSHYGRYVRPFGGRQQRGIYAYAAANNYHNNKPFGAYKIYEDARRK